MKIEIETQYDNPELVTVLKEIVKFYGKMTLGKVSIGILGEFTREEYDFDEGTIDEFSET